MSNNVPIIPILILFWNAKYPVLPASMLVCLGELESLWHLPKSALRLVVFHVAEGKVFFPNFVASHYTISSTRNTSLLFFCGKDLNLRISNKRKLTPWKICCWNKDSSSLICAPRTSLFLLSLSSRSSRTFYKQRIFNLVC